LREGLVDGRWLEECLGVPFRSSGVTDDVENDVRVRDVERGARALTSPPAAPAFVIVGFGM
jgi:hypothetical protein